MTSTISPAPEAATILPPALAQGSNAVLRTWLKQNGDAVATDEPVAELETDKVVVEVFAPCDGVLEVIAAENTPVAADTVLGRVVMASALQTPSPALRAPSPTSGRGENIPSLQPARDGSGERVGEHPTRLDHTRFSPSVRRLLAEHPIDPSSIQGTGRGGRLTREDVMKAIEAQSHAQSLSRPSGTLSHTHIPHTPTRRQIAQHMQQSLATAPHVTAVFEADLSAILRHRAAHKAHFAQQDTPLTLSAYFIAAAATAMRTVPTVNSRWHEDYLEVYPDVNIGVGTALGERGLIVPVIHRAQNLSLAGIAARLTTLTQAARNGNLKPQDVQGGTFTLSNYGNSGALLAAPIVLNQGQAAILGVGAMQKRVVVVEVNGTDSLQIRPMAYVTLTIDHRVLNGEQANAWLARFVEVIEQWD